LITTDLDTSAEEIIARYCALNQRRVWSRWYRHKKTISIDDTLIAFRRARITTIDPAQPTPTLFDNTAVTSTTPAA
jgi:hypothetical protein